MSKFIKADKFYFPDTVKESGYLEISDEGKFGTWREAISETDTVLDYSGYQIIPGLVDTHIHGYKGADVMDNTTEAIETMSHHLLEMGVTSFLPTTLTDTHDSYMAVCQTIGDYAGQETGAKIQGIYCEGPYFTEEYKGAQNADYMRDPSWEEFSAWQEASHGLIKKIALAPERPGVEAFVRQATANGVTVALGHSNATYKEAAKAVKAGASVWVHAFNGMRNMSHRELGMVGAMYNLKDTYAELIVDGYHVDPMACEILIHQKGSDYIAMITDCMRAGGLPDGNYMLGEYPVYVAEGTARLHQGDNLAGSILKLKDGLKNAIEWGLAKPEDAVRMVTLNPAKSVGIDDVCGQIKEGLDADFLVLDKDFELVETYLNGQSAYQAS